MNAIYPTVERFSRGSRLADVYGCSIHSAESAAVGRESFPSWQGTSLRDGLWRICAQSFGAHLADNRGFGCARHRIKWLRNEPIPDWLLHCVGEVGGELGLDEDWFNDAASVLKNLGFPAGMMERAKRERFGQELEVAIASRVDLIAMKCLAALDPKSGRKHLEDLVDLAPSGEELMFAQVWLFARPTSLEFRKAFERLCLVLGHEIDVPGRGKV